MEEKPETPRRSGAPSTLETLRLEPEQAHRLALESTSDALPTNPLGHAVPRPEGQSIAGGKRGVEPQRTSNSITTRPPPPRSERSTATPSVSPLKRLLDGHAGEWREVPSEPKIRLEDEATRPDLRAIRRPIRIARDGGFDDDQPTQPARHLVQGNARGPRERKPASDPRMLLVGFPEGLELAVCQGLKRQSIRVVVGSQAVLSQALLERVDFLVLYGDPRGSDVQGCLGRISKLHLPDLCGVVLVSDDTSLPARVLALRHGATSVIPRSPSVGLLVERIAHVAWGTELSDEQACEREATVQELMGTLAEELENRLRAPGESTDPRGATRLVFSAARELPRLIDDMVQRVGADIERVEHWDYELEARGARAWLEDDAQPLSGARVALIDDDAMRADAVAHELRERGAHVLVIGSALGDVAWTRLARFDPLLLVFDASNDEGWRRNLKERQSGDPSLHRATRAAVDLGSLWKVSESFPNTEPVTRELNRVMQRQRRTLERLRAGERLALADLDISLGQLLRGLAGEGCRLELEVPGRRFRAWLADGVLIGATEELVGSEEQRVSEGLSALSQLLGRREGSLSLAPAPPSSGPPNLISPLDVALGQALLELRGAAERSAQPRQSEPAPSDSFLVFSAPLTSDAETLPPVPAQSTPPHPQTQGTSAGSEGPWLPSSAALRPPIDPVRFQRKRVWGGWLWLAAALTAVGGAGFGLTLLLRAPTSEPAMKARIDSSPAQAVAARQKEASPPARPLEAASKPAPPVARLALEDALGKARAQGFSVKGAPVTDCTAKEPSVTAGQAIAQARRALMSGKLEAATLHYCDALALLPDDAQLMTELARVYLQRGAGAQAVRWAKRAHELSPKTLNQVLLGDALALDGQFSEARAAWAEAWKIRSQATLAAIAAAHFHTASRAATQRDYAKAERFMRRVALLDPERADAPLGLAKVMLEVSTTQGLPRYAEAKAWGLRAAALCDSGDQRDLLQSSLQIVRDSAKALGEGGLAAEAEARLAAKR